MAAGATIHLEETKQPQTSHVTSHNRTKNDAYVPNLALSFEPVHELDEANMLSELDAEQLSHIDFGQSTDVPVVSGATNLAASAYYDVVHEEVKQDYKILNDETLCEIEEIAPEDLYSYDAQFNTHTDKFFDEADFDDAFNWRVMKTEPTKVLATIRKVRKKCEYEFKQIDVEIKR